MSAKEIPQQPQAPQAARTMVVPAEVARHPCSVWLWPCQPQASSSRACEKKHWCSSTPPSRGNRVHKGNMC